MLPDCHMCSIIRNEFLTAELKVFNMPHIQSVTKIMGKTAIWTILCFYLLNPLNNVDKQWAKFVSSYVVGLQHYIGQEGEFQIFFFKFP